MADPALLADENIDGRVVAGLRAAGFEIAWVAEAQPGAHDESVLAMADDAGAILITDDTDFGELVYGRRLVTAGVVLVRLHGLDGQTKTSILEHMLREHGDHLQRAFTVVDRRQIRVRPLPE